MNLEANCSSQYANLGKMDGLFVACGADIGHACLLPFESLSQRKASKRSISDLRISYY